jgi:hypothetical protein
LRAGLERRLEKIARRVAGPQEMVDQQMAEYEARVMLGYLYFKLLIEHGIDPDDPDADQRLREIEPCEPAETGL